MEIRDNVFCFVGKFPVDTGPMQRRLQGEGGRVTEFDDPDLKVLVLGEKAKSKEKAAAKRGLTVMKWAQFVDAVGPA